MSFFSDLKTLYHVAVKPLRGSGQAARLESFYAGQAEHFDDFRGRLLHGRREMFSSMEVPPGGVWADLGGGTGWNLEQIGPRIGELSKVYLVDLSPSMLTVARQRIAARGWTNVETVEADITTFRPPEGRADVVTFSYSLTMVPDWFTAVENAWAVLQPGGVIGTVDFYVSRKHPAAGLAQHRFFGRCFWPAFFSLNDVFLSPDHLPYLRRRFTPVLCREARGRVPYLPLLRVPYYFFIGRKRTEDDASCCVSGNHKLSS
ncbi:MAG: class I SAM-dependent methyltransferase [Pirellulales bacterium]|nr:class I SAM-dependent methyltransferase [Pirellulales bacterium]